MPCCRHLKFHALIGISDSDNVTKRNRDTVRYINYLISAVIHYIVYIKYITIMYAIYAYA